VKVNGGAVARLIQLVQQGYITFLRTLQELGTQLRQPRRSQEHNMRYPLEYGNDPK